MLDGQTVIGDARDAPAQARRCGQIRGLQRGGDRGEAGGRDDQAVLFELEQARQESRPATRLGRQHQRRALPGDARRARQARELAIERLRRVGEHLRFDGRPRIASRRLRRRLRRLPSVAARAASAGRSANRRCSTSEAQQRIEARVLDHGRRPRRSATGRRRRAGWRARSRRLLRRCIRRRPPRASRWPSASRHRAPRSGCDRRPRRR